MRRFFLALMMLIYVAPCGAGETCTIDTPCALSSVMAAGSVAPGETVYLLPGVYAGDFWALVSGTQAQPITFRSVPGTKVVIDGSLRIDGADTIWKGLEITYTGWTSRTVTTSGSVFFGPNQSGLNIYGVRTRIENCYVHDTAYGIGLWKPAVDSVIDGCLIANNGWAGPDRRHGHAIYAQNDVGTKTIKNNIILPQYADIALNVYGSSAASLTGFDVISNTIRSGKTLIGGGSAAGRIRVQGNIVWDGLFDLGYWGVENNQDAVVEGNIFATTFLASGWQSLTVRNNTFERQADNLRLHYPPSHVRYDIDQNTYRCPYTAPCPFQFTLYNQGLQRSFAAWKAETPYDASSTAIYNNPGQNRVIYGAGQVTIFNYTNAASVSVDIPGLTPGASYRLVNAQNVTETLAFTAGASVSLPTGGWSVATPFAGSAPLAPFDPKFIVFLVEPL
jgi:hypothetical protein